MFEEVLHFYTINNPSEWYFPYMVVGFIVYYLLMAIFLGLFIFYLVRLIRNRKLYPSSTRFFPKAFGFFFALLLQGIGLLLWGIL
ncbi:MAG: hypothetical protein FK730_14610 [Asgard group archaeon]|nr:hypothetical protein [Asgard group archaeon]